MIINDGVNKSLPNLSNPATAADLLINKQLIDSDGNIVNGTMPIVTHPVPLLSVGSNGLITASHQQESGKVTGGQAQATHQLTTQAGKTITPGTSQKTAVASSRYTTGPVYVAGDSNLKATNIKSGVNIFGVKGTYGGTNIKVLTGNYWDHDSNGYSSSLSDVEIDSNAKGLIGVLIKSESVFLWDTHEGLFPTDPIATFMSGFTPTGEPVSVLDMDGVVTFNSGSRGIAYGFPGVPGISSSLSLRVGITSHNGRKFINFNSGFDNSSNSIYYVHGPDLEQLGVSYTIIYAV